MKKTVFLFLMMIITVLKLSIPISAAEFTYDFNDYKIIISTVSEDGSVGFTIEKTGINPFFTTIVNNSEFYTITNVEHIDNYFILYGYGFVSNSTTEYDTLFIVLDEAGNLVHKELRDYGEMEIILDFYYFDNTFIAYVEQTIDNDFNYVFESSFFAKYDQNFNFIDSIKVESPIKKIAQNEFYIMIGFNDNILFNLAIRSDLSIFESGDDLLLDESEIYYDYKLIEFLNSASLNTEFIENGILLEYPGIYHFVYQNKSYNFTIKPTILGIVNDYVYNSSVTPTIDSGNIFLNNDLFISGTTIKNPGLYDLTVIGTNGYQEEINFTITSGITGVINNHIYNDSITIEFNGDGYLNNQLVESPCEISETGEYILKIQGANNYLETYYFEIEEEVSKASLTDFVQKFDILVLVVVLISGGIILKKK